MKICLACNAEYDDSRNFCKNCGQPLSALKESSPVAFCPECGNNVSVPGSKFCKHCGAQLPQLSLSDQPSPRRQPAPTPPAPIPEPGVGQIEKTLPEPPKAPSDVTTFESIGQQSSNLSGQSKRTLWISAAALLLVFLGGIGVLLYTKSGSRGQVVRQTEEIPTGTAGDQTAGSVQTRVPDAQATNRSVPERRLPTTQSSDDRSSGYTPSQTYTPTPPLIPDNSQVEARGLESVAEPSRPSTDETLRTDGSTFHDFQDELFGVETLSPLSASGSRQGDRIRVRVLTPERFKNAHIEGEVAKSKAAGKVSGKSELLFRFDSLVLTNGKTIPIDANLVGLRNAQGAPDIDEEGHVIGRSSKRGDITKTAVSSGVGALIGGILGGKEGIAKGAAIGAAVGLTMVFSTRGEDIKFNPGSVFQLSVSSKSEDRP